MQPISTVTLSRDCEVVRIPAGDRIMLPAGTEVDITQRLGGSYTIYSHGGLFRVAGKDGDALGLPVATAAPAAPAASEGSESVDEQAIWEVLRTCFDPEIPVNIVDLGLVYELKLDPGAAGGQRVGIKMTLTAPGCGMGTAIAADAQEKILGLAGVETADVEVVWDPPWHPSRISPEGRRVLGLE